MPDAVNPVSTPPAATSPLATGSPTTTATQDIGKDTFLKLLVAQMKYQNPMSPTDGSQFLAQTAQFSMVEKLEQLATQSTQMLTAQESTTATGMLGQTVVATGKDGKDITGIVTGMKITADGPVLKINGADYAYAAIKEVDTSPKA
jgi:flagellar basal-body rod modification protein FlgD